MAIGIRECFVTNADFSVAANVVPALVTGGGTALQVAIAANQKLKFCARLALSIGAAAGGWRFQITVPAAGSYFLQDAIVVEDATNTIVAISQIVASAVVTGIGILAGGIIDLSGYIVNGATAGNVSILFAQSVSDPLASVVLRGSYLETVKLN